MKPNYSAIIKSFTKTGVDVDFAQPLAPETAVKFKDLEKYNGVKVHNNPLTNGLFIRFTPFWSAEDVKNECLGLLVSEGFDRDKILVQ